MRFVMLIVFVSISIVCFSQQTQLPGVPTITEAPAGFDGISNGLVACNGGIGSAYSLPCAAGKGGGNSPWLSLSNPLLQATS